MTRAPIFFARTRSFWLGWLPALLTLLDVVFAVFADPASAAPVSGVVSALLSFVGLDVDPGRIEGVMRDLSPIYALIVAQQRAGAARPYTVRLSAETLR